MGEDVDAGLRGVAATRCKLSTVAEAATKVSGSLVFLEDWRTPMRGVAVAAVASAQVGGPLVVMEQSGGASPGPTSVGAGHVAAAVPVTPSVAVACLTSALAEDGFAVAVVPAPTALSCAAGREPISGTVLRTMAAGIAVRPAGAAGMERVGVGVVDVSVRTGAAIRVSTEVSAARLTVDNNDAGLV